MSVTRRRFLKFLGAVGIGGSLPLVSLPLSAISSIKPVTKAIENGNSSVWVRFDGTGNSPKILDSHGVSSVVQTGKGQYQVNFNRVFDRPPTVVLNSPSSAYTSGVTQGNVHAHISGDQSVINMMAFQGENNGY
jgi:hypothetical protein